MAAADYPFTPQNDFYMTFVKETTGDQSIECDPALKMTKLDTGDTTMTLNNLTVSGNLNVNGTNITSTGSGAIITSDERNKLTGIEASADITDSTNVAAAGALMDSEVNDLDGIKGVTISTLQVKPSEGAFADGDKTKLDTIATSANNYSLPTASASVLGGI